MISNAANPTNTAQTLPHVSITASPAIVTASTSGMETVTFTVTLTTPSEQTVIVPYTTAGYTVTPGPLAFIPPDSGPPIQRTFAVTIDSEPPDSCDQDLHGQPRPTDERHPRHRHRRGRNFHLPQFLAHSDSNPDADTDPDSDSNSDSDTDTDSDPDSDSDSDPDSDHPRPHRRSPPGCSPPPAKGRRSSTRTSSSSAPRSTPPRRRIPATTTITQKISKKKTANVRVVAATYSAGNNSVTLTLGKPTPGKALQVMVSGLQGAGGTPVGTFVTNL